MKRLERHSGVNVDNSATTDVIAVSEESLWLATVTIVASNDIIEVNITLRLICLHGLMSNQYASTMNLKWHVFLSKC